jgi:hypothetical protein
MRPMLKFADRCCPSNATANTSGSFVSSNSPVSLSASSGSPRRPAALSFLYSCTPASSSSALKPCSSIHLRVTRSTLSVSLSNQPSLLIVCFILATPDSLIGLLFKAARRQAQRHNRSVVRQPDAETAANACALTMAEAESDGNADVAQLGLRFHQLIDHLRELIL